MLEQVADILEALESRQTAPEPSPWISVNDQPVPMDEQTLCWCGDFYVTRDDLQAEDFESVTHWMPIPPVPKQRERWIVFTAAGVTYIKHGEYSCLPSDLVDILNAHQITPATPPIDKERGRELVEIFDEGCLAAEMLRDWIASVVGEGELGNGA